MNEREKNVASALIAPDASPLGLRRLSPASLTMLQMLGNPIASFEVGSVLMFDLLQYAWIHSADLDTVRALVVREVTEPGAVAVAVLEWAEHLPTDFLAHLRAELETEMERTAAALAVAAPGTAPKNELGRSSS